MKHGENAPGYDSLMSRSNRRPGAFLVILGYYFVYLKSHNPARGVLTVPVHAPGVSTPVLSAFGLSFVTRGSGAPNSVMSFRIKVVFMDRAYDATATYD